MSTSFPYAINFHSLGYQLLTIATPGADLTAIEKQAQTQHIFTAYEVRDSGHIYVWGLDDTASTGPHTFPHTH